jgi:predicted alpha-1,6-mannanase (GH76 family)
MRTVSLRAVLLLLLITISAAAQQPSVSHQESMRRLQAGIEALQQWYLPDTGLYRTTGWWNAANAMTTLADAMRAVGSHEEEATLANTFRAAQITIPPQQQVGVRAKMTGFPGFLNKFYDDEGWWALAWINAYDLTARPEYLAMAQSIFHDMQGGWDGTCGGGIWWSKDRMYKNAIANELFFDVAASLARRGAESDRAAATNWAGKEWEWFQSTGMINGDHLVNDGLTIDKIDGTCHNNGRTVWTYNQGVLLGALAQWSHVKHDNGLLMEARILADAGLSHLTDGNGILHDPCEPACGEDANQFKGIFVRNLRLLNREVQEPRYRAFLSLNAVSLWENARTSKNEFGVVWSGPVAEVNAGTQSSALDALVAAVGER